MTSESRRTRKLIVVPAVVTVVAAGLVAGQGAAGAAGTARNTARPAAAQASATSSVLGRATTRGVVRHLTRQASSTRFPRAHRVSAAVAAKTAKAAQRAERYTGQSHSPRLRTVTTNGVRRLAAGPTSWLPVVRPTGVSATRPRLARTWDGLDAADNQRVTGFGGFEPPDQGLCAGAGHVLEFINVSARIFNTDGTPASPAVDINRFFHRPPLIDPATNRFGFELSDPSCFFDPGSKRFFATVLALELDPETGALTLINGVDVAVSKTSNPLGGWSFYHIPVTDIGAPNGPQHKGCPCVGDFPHLGTDANGLYVTTNEYPWSDDPGVFGNNFNGAQVYALDKHALVNDTRRVTVVHFNNTRVTDASGTRHPGFTLWPTLPTGSRYATASNGSEFFTSSFASEEAQPGDFVGHSTMLGLWQLTNTASLRTGSPALVLHAYLLRSESYGVPPVADQKPGPTPLLDCLRVQCQGDGSPYTADVENGLDSSDSRILASVLVRGRILTALDTVMQVSDNLQSGVAWFALQPAGRASHVTSQGYVGITGQNVIYPGIATTPSGSGVMGLTLSGKAFYPSAAYQFIGLSGPSGPVHIAGLGKGPEDGVCEYAFFNCGGTDPPTARPRWGDYAAAAWDGHRLYIANEFIAQRCTFAQFNADTTCGGTRVYLSNFSTRISALTPPTS